MNKQQVELAVGTGIQLFGNESEIVIPIKHNDGVFLLKQLLNAIATGQLALQPTAPQLPEGIEPPVEATPITKKTSNKKA